MLKSDLRTAANSERIILAFNGAIETRILTNLTNPPRAFAFEVTFHPHIWPAMLQEKKPPLHFHPFQEEYIQVQAGRLCVEQSSRKQILSAADGEICIKPWVHHCLYPLAEDVSRPVGAAVDTQAREEEDKTIKFLISGEETDRIFRLDTIFFENWYAYQDEVILQNKSIDLIQVLTMFDAGGSYLSLPWWIPFNRTVSMSIGIAIGRWLAPLLGYQPYYAKWTSDWQLACEKMEKSLFQRRFAMKKQG